MSTAIKDLISSKKFITAIVAIVVLLGLRLGVHIDETTATLVAGLFATLITGQAVADIGKASTEIKAGKTLVEVTKESDARIAAPPAVVPAPVPIATESVVTP